MCAGIQHKQIVRLYSVRPPLERPNSIRLYSAKPAKTTVGPYCPVFGSKPWALAFGGAAAPYCCKKHEHPGPANKQITGNAKGVRQFAKRKKAQNGGKNYLRVIVNRIWFFLEQQGRKQNRKNGESLLSILASERFNCPMA